MEATRNKVDWESVSRHYRAGIRSLRDIANEFGISEGAIRKRAKKEGWPRDLKEQIRAKADEKVRIEAVRRGTQGTAERDVIEANADMLAAKHIEHRRDIPAKRDLVAKLFAEVEALTDGADMVAQMQMVLEQGDMDALARTAERVASLPARIKGVTDLVGAYKALIMLERQAFGMESGFGEGGETPAGFMVGYLAGPGKPRED